MAYLSLEINTGDDSKPNWQYATLAADTSISMENISAVWDTDAGGGAFSYEFQLPVEDNLHILGSSCEMRGVSVYKQLYGKKFRLYAGGLCVAYGIVKLDDSVEIEEDDDGNKTVSISLASNNKEWDDILSGVNARDVKISKFVYNSKPVNGQDPSHHPSLDTDWNHNVQIGYCLPLYTHVEGTLTGYGFKRAYDDLGDTPVGSITEKFETDVMLPQLMIPTDAFTNTQKSYKDGAPYCNATICYSQYLNMGTSNEAKWEKQRGYCIGKPDRINSAPCFYVLYWMDLLFEQLKVCVTNNSLKKYEDLMRLAFFHTDCHYESIDIPEGDPDYKKKTAKFHDDDNDTNMNINDSPLQAAVKLNFERLTDGSVWPVTGKHTSSTGQTLNGVAKIQFIFGRSDYIKIDGYNLGSTKGGMESFWTGMYTMDLRKAYATSENFPDTDAKDILDGIQNAFGARFLFNAQEKSMNIILIKDILKQTSATSLDCDIYKVTKVENHITGFRLKYSATQDASVNAITLEEELTGVKAGTEGTDTTFSYNNYTNVVPLKEPYCQGITAGDEYRWLLQHVSAYDKSCYYNESTADAFRIKIDGDSDGGSTINPALFEVAQFTKAEWGDCSMSSDNKDFIEEVTIGFTPIVENDVNTYAERGRGIKEQLMAQLVDGEIRSYNYPDGVANKSGKNVGDFTYSCITFPMSTDIIVDSYASGGDAHNHTTDAKNHAGLKTIATSLKFEIKALETWDLGNEHPTYSNDTGFCLGIMRGSGSDAHTIEYDDDYDQENGTKWENASGSHPQFTSDCINKYGSHYDYNGSGEIIGEQYQEITITQAQAKAYINNNFPNSNANLLSTSRANVIWHTGWPAEIENDPYYPLIYSKTIGTQTYYYIFTPIQDDGNVINGAAFDSYVQHILGQETWEEVEYWDATSPQYGAPSGMFGNKLIIGKYETQDEASKAVTLLNELGVIIYGGLSSGTIHAMVSLSADNGLGYLPEDAISLRLRVLKPNPGYDTTCSKAGYKYINDGKDVILLNGVTLPNDKYLPCTNETHAHRGLADKFYEEYATWVLNRKIAVITCEMELATLLNIDMTKKYKIGELEGFVKQLSYTLDNEEGLSLVDIEFYYM